MSPAETIARAVRRILDDHIRNGWSPKDLYHRVIFWCERPLIEAVLREYRGSRRRTAQALGISRNTLAKKMREHGIN